MKELFLLSGLGADKRVFDFLDLRNYNVHHIEWPTPQRNESLAEYAERILPQITHPKPILIGVSFGGMVAQEIGKLIRVEKIILISSAKSATAIPSLFKFMSKLNLQKLVPPRSIKKPNEIIFWLFGVSTKEHRALLTSIMADTDEAFFIWAMETITTWDNTREVDHVVQIHGTKDRILKLEKADFVIEGGGHLMVVTKAAEVSKIIKTILN